MVDLRQTAFRRNSTRTIAVFFTIAMAMAFLGSAVAPGFAQDRPRSLFDLLFRPGKPREVEVPKKQPRATIKRRTSSSGSVEVGPPPPEAVAAPRERHPTAEVFTYPGTGHAFNREVDPAVYDAGSAQLAHRRTMQLFEHALE